MNFISEECKIKLAFTTITREKSLENKIHSSTQLATFHVSFFPNYSKYCYELSLLNIVFIKLVKYVDK